MKVILVVGPATVVVRQGIASRIEACPVWAWLAEKTPAASLVAESPLVVDKEELPARFHTPVAPEPHIAVDTAAAVVAALVAVIAEEPPGREFVPELLVTNENISCSGRQ